MFNNLQYCKAKESLKNKLNRCTSQAPNREKTRKEVSVLDVGRKPQRIIPGKSPRNQVGTEYPVVPPPPTWFKPGSLYFSLEGPQQFSSGKGHFYQESVNLYWTFVKGTTAEAQGTTAIAVGARGYFKASFRFRLKARKDTTTPTGLPKSQNL